MTGIGRKAAAGLLTGLVIGALSIGAAHTAAAQNTVKIGVIFPLSGNAAAAGINSKIGVEVAADIVNNRHPELKGIPLAAGAGLPNLKGAKVELIIADHQGDPSVGAAQTVRLITQEKVVAMMGVYHSSVAVAATAEAEKNGIPFVIGDSVAMAVTQRGFKYTFRVTPNAVDLAKVYGEFLADISKKKPVKTIALVNENTDYGTSVAKGVNEELKKAGYDVVAVIPYSANTTDVTAQVLQLKEKNPDAVMFITYTNDAILYMKTLRNLNYRPPIVIGDDAGFSDPSFLPAVGPIAQGVFNRSAYSIGKPGSVSYKINQMFRAKSGGKDMDDPTGRSLQGMLVLCDAINRAGSTAPEAIQKALRETNLKANQIALGYKGVKFDETGQNILASTFITQLYGSTYYAVWPLNRQEHKIEHFFKGW